MKDIRLPLNRVLQFTASHKAINMVFKFFAEIGYNL